MKVIKKMTAIMLSIMMVLGMSSVVSAAGSTTGSGSYADNDGKITIDNAISGQTYKLYRILQLESFSGENYAYTVESGWDDFVTDPTTGGQYLTKADGYVTWKGGKDDTRYKDFAKAALAYAQSKSITAIKEENSRSATVTFSGLPLGYYLVDSSTGAICSLTTTNKEATIEEKNGVPSVEKKVQEDSKKNTANEYGDTNTADIGDTVNFKTTITAQAGAQNYVLHDKMSEGLSFADSSVQIQWTKKSDGTTTPLVSGTDYDVTTTGLETMDPKCTFHVTFKKDFCDKLAKDDTIVITYSATLNKQAKVGTSENTNKTWLMYGENPGIKSNEDSTTTFTYKIPVFKYTGSDQGLAGAEFQLNRVEGTTKTPIKVVKTSREGATEEVYRVATTTEQPTALDIVTTISSGKFTIEGLDAGTYYLTETKQPDGYNKLSKAVKIVIDENGNIFVNDGASSTSLVKVENKSGSLLPSTGGRGTTLFYILGAILVVGSGVVLITKKRMK